MGKTFFIGDLHWGDATIRKLEDRPFKDVYEQTDLMFEYWNEMVKQNDTVFIVGDFLHVGCEEYHLKRAKELLGRKILIRGNHDTLPAQFYKSNCDIETTYDFPILYEDFFIVSHDPKYINKSFPYANIFAHVHNSPIYNTHSQRHYCVSAERIGYRPILFDEIWETMKKDEMTQ